jgi:hypothetical protein
MDVFRNWVLEDPGTRVPLTLTTLGLLLVLPLVGFAVYLWRMAARAVEGREFPPKGYRVVPPVPSMSGEAAISRARGVRAIAIFLVVAAAALVIMLWRFAVLIT